MATIKGVMRSYGATVRRMEREQQRANREAAKRYKEMQKQLAMEEAQQQVEVYEKYLYTILNVHEGGTEKVDWGMILDEPEPNKLLSFSKNEQVARENLTNYKPNWFERNLGIAKTKEKELTKLIEKAKIEDKKIVEESHKAHKTWVKLTNLANNVKNQNPEGYKEAIEYFQPFSDLQEFGSQINIQFEAKYILIDFHVHSDEVVPKEEYKLTKTGKLSKKNTPKSRFNENYQDYVCSCILRLAKETFAYLPVDIVLVHGVGELLNTKTGHFEEKPILSVGIPEENLMRLNFSNIDPSDAMENFVHNMSFAKTRGFKEVKKLEITDFKI